LLFINGRLITGKKDSTWEGHWEILKVLVNLGLLIELEIMNYKLETITDVN
jgi:hypothetical protein